MEREIGQIMLIDTDILIDASRKLEAAGRFLDERQQKGDVTISIVSAMELIAGCRSAVQLAGVRRFLDQCDILPLTEAISERARELMEAFTLSHGLLLPDALIAATAIEAGIPICTRNIRHFSMIPKLDTIQPY